MTAAVLMQQTLDQATQLRSGFEAKIGVQQYSVAGELAHGFRLVALG